MKFLALSPIAAYALLAAVAAVIALLHLLKPPPLRVIVPSMLLWARLGRVRQRPPARRLLALLLALGAGLSLALALSRPEIAGIGAAARQLTLILDNSPSMAARTRDGRSRWQHATEGARALLEQAGAASEVKLADTGGLYHTPDFIDRDSALAALAGIPLPAWGNVRAPPAALMAGTQVHVFSDGVAQLEMPAGAIVHSVFEPADNVAVTAFEARPFVRDPTRYEALVQVLNASASAQRVRVRIAGGANFSIVQDVDVDAGETINARFDISDFEGGVLGAAAIGQSDAFPIDDMAYAVVPPHGPKRVLLVTAGNALLEDALRNVPGVRLSVAASESYAGTSAYDAYVFDRFAPAQPPPRGALLLQPPSRNWLAGAPRMLTAPRITDWNDSHPVTSGIAWRDVRVARGAVDTAAQLGANGLVLARGFASGALVSVGESKARWVKVGFALQDSNFALQPDFPVFVGQALSWLTQPVPVLSRGLGSVEVALRQAQVVDGDGTPVNVSATAHGSVFEAARADVYAVSSSQGELLVVANLPDRRYALINRSTLQAAEPSTLHTVASPRLNYAELWMLLVLLALVLMLIEWAAFTRRLTS